MRQISKQIPNEELAIMLGIVALSILFCAGMLWLALHDLQPGQITFSIPAQLLMTK